MARSTCNSITQMLLLWTDIGHITRMFCVCLLSREKILKRCVLREKTEINPFLLSCLSGAGTSFPSDVCMEKTPPTWQGAIPQLFTFFFFFFVFALSLQKLIQWRRTVHLHYCHWFCSCGPLYMILETAHHHLNSLSGLKNSPTLFQAALSRSNLVGFVP